MKTIKILGTGCPNCKKTEIVVRKVIKELNLKINIEKVEDIQDIIAYDVMSTPAIVLDERVVIKGHVPNADEIKNLLTADCCNEEDSSCCGEKAKQKNLDSCC